MAVDGVRRWRVGLNYSSGWDGSPPCRLIPGRLISLVANRRGRSEYSSRPAFMRIDSLCRRIDHRWLNSLAPVDGENRRATYHLSPIPCPLLHASCSCFDAWIVAV